jgi:hypothetical protein
LFFLAIIAPGVVSAEPASDAGNLQPSAMHSGPGSGIVLVAQNDPDQNHAPAGMIGAYNHLATYKGIYEPKRIYKRTAPSGGWTGNRNPSHLNQVRCPEAYAALNAGRLWTGNFSKDGSCGNPAEPPEWALGNYLNYLNAAAGDEQ